MEYVFHSGKLARVDDEGLEVVETAKDLRDPIRVMIVDEHASTPKIFHELYGEPLYLHAQLAITLELHSPAWPTRLDRPAPDVQVPNVREVVKVFEGGREGCFVSFAFLCAEPQGKRQRHPYGNGEPTEQGYVRVKLEVERAETRDHHNPFRSRVRVIRALDTQGDRLQ